MSFYQRQRLIPFTIGLLMLGFGALVFVEAVAEPVAELREVWTWPEGQCFILGYESEVLSASYYRQNVTYQVLVPGRGRFTARRVDVLDGEVGTYRSLGSYAPGTTVPCWYDPDDPARAVLFRSVSLWQVLGLGLLLLAFVGGGGLFVYSALARGTGGT